MTIDSAYLYWIVQIGPVIMSLITEALSLRKSASARNLTPF
jgi:hypothetical protein